MAVTEDKTDKGLTMYESRVVWAKKLEELFALDPDVEVVYEHDTPIVTVYVRGEDKAESISEILPDEVTFASGSMPVEVIPANADELTPADHLRRAFAGNPALVDVVESPVVPKGPSMTYALFAPEVAQLECDNAGSPYGLLTTTYEALAKDVLDVDGILIASEVLAD